MRKLLNLSVATFLVLALAACDGPPISPETSGEADANRAARGSGVPDETYTFDPPAFDLAAGPNGSLLVPVTVFPVPEIPEEGATSTTIIHEIGQDGETREIAEVTTVEGAPVNGLEANGQGDFLVTSGGTDLAVGTGVLRVSRGGQRLVGDIERFETNNDPDAFEGLEWKDQRCEAVPPFSAGPQSNPYHLALRPGGEALVGDAAGNTVLSIENPGRVDWVAILSPPTEDGSGSSDSGDWMVLFTLEDGTDCYVQPVSTSVAIGPDGDMYVGELTGVTPADLGGPGPTTGLSRVWRIDAGAQNVVCPSDRCEVALTGFTSIIDLAFGPDGGLAVVEYDENGWFTALEADPPNPAGGAVRRCDPSADADKADCDLIEDGLDLPGAVAFDARGGLWVLESTLFAPTVRKLE